MTCFHYYSVMVHISGYNFQWLLVLKISVIGEGMTIVQCCVDSRLACKWVVRLSIWSVVISAHGQYVLRQ
jgi:hypothetical protein